MRGTARSIDTSVTINHSDIYFCTWRGFGDVGSSDAGVHSQQLTRGGKLTCEANQGWHVHNGLHIVLAFNGECERNDGIASKAAAVTQQDGIQAVQGTRQFIRE